MLFVQLDSNWPDNYKIIEAGLEGAGLHAIVMCLAKRMETDGWVRRPLLHRQGATDELIDRLVDLCLLDADGLSVRPHDWLARNRSQAAISASRASKVRAGRAGNHSRYGHIEPLAECSQCGPEPPQNPSVLAPAIAEASLTLAEASPELEPEPYPEPEPAAASASPPATTADLRQALLAAAADIIGKRAAQRPGVDNPAACARAVARAVAIDRHQDAYAIIAADPSISAADLVERLEPTVVPSSAARNPSTPIHVVEPIPRESQHWEEGAVAVGQIREKLGIPRRSGADR